MTRDGLLGSARQMRKEPTEAEALLRAGLRGRQFAGMHIRRQRPIGPYIVDFCCLQRKLVIEVDGDHHLTTEYVVYDTDRTTFLETRRFRVLRISNATVMTNIDEALRLIEEAGTN